MSAPFPSFISISVVRVIFFLYWNQTCSWGCVRFNSCSCYVRSMFPFLSLSASLGCSGLLISLLRPLLKIHFSIATSNQQWFATPRGIRHKYYKWCKFWVEQENYVRIKDTRTLIWLYLRSPANRGFSQSIFVAFEHINASLYWPAPTRLGPLSPLLVGLVIALLQV